MNDYDRWRLTNADKKIDDVPEFVELPSCEELLAEGNELYANGDVTAARSKWTLAYDKALREGNAEIMKQARTYLEATK